MTAISTTRLLLVGASGLALAAPLSANEVLFTTAEARPESGERTSQGAGLTQVALTGGGTVSIVDAADYRINPDGSIDLYEGSLTLAGSDAGEALVRMPGGLEGRVSGAGSAGSFSVREGEASGHALTGTVRVGRGRAVETYGAGEHWRARGRGRPRRVVASGAQVQPGAEPAGPGSVVPIGGDAGPVAAALNGIPVTFADQLAAAGASSDILAAARRLEAVVGNPSLETFPSGDFALLVAVAARLETAYGGEPFAAARADIIRTYLRFLAGGGAGSEFVTAYSGFTLAYLDFLRAGGLPSGFAAASPADIEAWLAYVGRTGALAELAARDRVLAEAYLAFLAGGGNRNAFTASFTDLTTAYFAFVRGGGDPAAFTGASEAVLADTIAFLAESGLARQLGATDRALLEAFLANGGLAFAAQYEAAFADYFDYLAGGRLPSDYTAVDQATLRAWLETLSDTGLLGAVLGERASFFADYLAFLRAGGSVDGFAGLPANIFAGYASELDAYFAFLASGRLPSEFSGTDIASLQAFVLELQAAGALERFLGDRASFFAQYAAFVRTGGSFDAFAGLPANIFAGYAADLAAFYAFLENGGVPSSYTLLDAATLREYIAALEAAGASGRFLGDLAGFWRDYAAFLAGGGNPDTFAQLPVPPDFPAFAAALNAYAAFLEAGGLPSDYSDADLAELAVFLEAIVSAGRLEELLGGNAGLLSGYFAFLAGGGSADGFAGLPLYLDYVAALNAYFDFLAGGGVPSDYTVLDAATIEAYLAALAALEGGLAGLADLNRFFIDYFAFISGGGDPNLFAGLPGNGSGGGGAGGNPDVPTMLAGYTGGFDPASAKINLILGGELRGGTFVGGETGFEAAPYALDANGGLTSYTRQPGGQRRNRGSAEVTDIFGNADAVIGRWTNGTIVLGNGFSFNENQGLHYMLARPVGPDFVPALTGRVDYYLIGATRPTIADGSLAPGEFEAGLALLFGSDMFLAMEGTITMPGGSDPYVFTFATEGGLADPTQSASLFSATGEGAFSGSVPASDNRGNCDANPELCVLNFRASFAGDEGTVGMTYDARNGGTATTMVGAAIFARGPERGAGNGGGGSGGGGGGSGGTASVDGIVPTGGLDSPFAFAGPGSTGEVVSAATMSVTDGVLRAARRGSVRVEYTPGANSEIEVSGDAGVIGWQRINRVTTVYSGGTGQVFQSNPFAEQYWHTIWGAPLVNLPTVGLVNYEFIGGSTAHQRNARPGDGAFSGRFSVDFASLRAGLEASVSLDGPDAAIYDFASEGGVAAPSMQLFDDGFGTRRFAEILPTTERGVGEVSRGTRVAGFLAGDGASHAGMTYAINTSSGNSIIGTAAFRATRSDPAAAAASIAPNGTARMMSIDMSRWGGAGSASPQGGSAPLALHPLHPRSPVAPGLDGKTGGEPALRRDAIDRAERLMGGLVTFPGLRAEPR